MKVYMIRSDSQAHGHTFHLDRDSTLKKVEGLIREAKKRNEQDGDEEMEEVWEFTVKDDPEVICELLFLIAQQEWDDGDSLSYFPWGKQLSFIEDMKVIRKYEVYPDGEGCVEI